MLVEERGLVAGQRARRVDDERLPAGWMGVAGVLPAHAHAGRLRQRFATGAERLDDVGQERQREPGEMTDARASSDDEVEILTVAGEYASDEYAAPLERLLEIDLRPKHVLLPGVLELPVGPRSDELAVDAVPASSGSRSGNEGFEQSDEREQDGRREAAPVCEARRRVGAHAAHWANLGGSRAQRPVDRGR